jgi:hypothetical protein
MFTEINASDSQLSVYYVNILFSPVRLQTILHALEESRSTASAVDELKIYTTCPWRNELRSNLFTNFDVIWKIKKKDIESDWDNCFKIFK